MSKYNKGRLTANGLKCMENTSTDCDVWCLKNTAKYLGVWKFQLCDET